jgi:hypothetical protein
MVEPRHVDVVAWSCAALLCEVCELLEQRVAVVGQRVLDPCAPLVIVLQVQFLTKKEREALALQKLQEKRAAGGAARGQSSSSVSSRCAAKGCGV